MTRLRAGVFGLTVATWDSSPKSYHLCKHENTNELMKLEAFQFSALRTGM